MDEFNRSFIDNFLFDNELTEKAMNQTRYVIGVDPCDENNRAYCLGRTVNGVFEVMLAKVISDEDEFKQEVENLSKYFNASVFCNKEQKFTSQ